ncbi:MAG: putative porin [Bacteroidales bacterium]|nr:putative porin [Bacteroidales bacterium]
MPALAVSLVAAQTMGFDMARADHYLSVYSEPDSVATNPADSFSLEEAELPPQEPLAYRIDSFTLDKVDTLDTLHFIDRQIAKDTVWERVMMLDRDWPDSVAFDRDMEFSPEEIYIAPPLLRFTDSLRYEWFVALKDSTTRAALRDTLLAHGDSLQAAQLDSLYLLDSAEVAKWKFDKWYSSLTRKERKKYDYEQALPAKIHRADSILHYKDSVKAYKDSVKDNTPRILETFAIPDSLQYRRMITWKLDRRFDDVKLFDLDTSFNYHYNDFEARKHDVNMTYLGVAGSAVQTYNFFKRDKEENVFFYTPYRSWSYSPETLTQFNTKTYYTELAYWGTLFSNRDKEESNIRIRTTQNITPALNLNLEYSRNGGNGMLQNEKVNNRTALVGLNYLGKKYLMHAGFIHNRVMRNENGGAIDTDPATGINWIRDTTVEVREIPVNLSSAASTLKKQQVFLDQSYRIPLSFKKRKKAEAEEGGGDTLTLDRNVTSAFIGHSSEFSVFRRVYTDKTDSRTSEYYNNLFYINPSASNDSLRVMRLENKVYLRLQPWKDDAIVSKIDVGVGDKLLSNYSMSPMSFLTAGKSNVRENSLYVYAGARGQYKQYFNWDANGKYNFAGAEINDFGIDANIYANFYPFRRDRKSPLSLDAHFSTALEEPEYYVRHMFTNHFRWDNDFSKISTTKVRAGLNIPKWKLSLDFGYALLANNVYYGADALPAQNDKAMSIISANLNKEFVLWKFHLDHKLMFQYSSNQEVVPLPLFSANLRYYFQFSVVKNVMEMQIGANAWYDTKWYAPAYNPAVGAFYVQTDTKYGNTPYIDAFVNIQWKEVSVFLRCENVNMGWPMDKTDYFSAAHYIRPPRSFKIGVFWPFCVKTSSHSHSHESSMMGGGGKSAAGAGNMRLSR